MSGDLSGLRVLVTAGPTWVPIDAVRHLSNFSTGGTGLHLARAFAVAGAEVTLLHGPGRARPAAEDRDRMEVVDFVTFEELHELVRARVGSREYEALIHVAAVSDYRPAAVAVEKRASGQREWLLRLTPTPKIVDEVKRLDPNIFLVKFKLEAGRTPEKLIEIGRESRARSAADLLVANDLRLLTPERHPAWILDAAGLIAAVQTRDELAAELIRLLAARATRRPEETPA